MKLFQKISAVITAFTICSTMCMIPVSADESADLPDWIPQNFAEAMKFSNQYGRIHIEDDLICCVRSRRSSSTETEVNGSAEVVFHAVCELDVPEKPDQSDTEAYAEYLRQLEELEIDKSLAEYIGLSDPGFYYDVTVYQPKEAGSIDINWSNSSLTFEVSDNGEITETDIYGWLPDCISEYYAFHEQYGNASVHENYIVFCDEEHYDGGYQLFWNQEGTAEVEEVINDTIGRTELFPAPGNSLYKIMVYSAVTPGTVQMNWTQRQPWMPEEDFVDQTVKNYQVDEDGTIHEIEPITIMGDVNNDGEFSVLDVVLFQKWLLGIPDTHLENWKAADFKEDNILNIFDLLLMKRALVNVKPSESQPMLLSIYENYAWLPMQAVQVYDQYGRSYEVKQSYDENDFYQLSADTWYTELCDIIQTNEPDAYREFSSEVMNEVNQYIQNIDQHQDCQMSDSIDMMKDGGVEKLYVVYQDDQGIPCYHLLSQYGDSCKWQECEDVQHILKQLYPHFEEVMNRAN